MAEAEIVALCHPMEYVEAIRERLARRRAWCGSTPTPSMSPGSFEAALRCVGGGVRAVDEVMSRQGRAMPSSRRARPATTPRRRGRWASACSTTPRSRRATRRRSTAPSASRSSISTCITATARRIFSGRTRRVMYCSTHEMPLYPGTGSIGERGEHNTIVNAPLRAGDGGEQFRAGDGERDPAAAARVQAGSAGDLGRLRRAHARSARQSQSGRGRLRLGDAEADGDRRAAAPTAASSRCWKAATTCRACRARPPRMSPR